MSAATASEKPLVLVTGCSGLIGQAVVKRLAQRYKVVGFDIKEPLKDLPVDFIQVNLSSAEQVYQAVKELARRHGKRVESVVHLAAYFDFSGDPSPEYQEVTIRGTARLLQALKIEMDVGQFIFSSTMLVYKPTVPGQPISEKSPIEGRWAYPKAKLQAEHLLREQHGDIPLVLLRLAGVYTDKCDSTPLAHQIRRIYERRVMGHIFPGDGSHGQPFVHRADVVDAVERVIRQRKQIANDQQSLLIGEPDTYPYDRLQREIALHIHGRGNWTTEHLPKAVVKTGTWIEEKIPGIHKPFVVPHMIDVMDDHYELDISRAESLLDWYPRHRVITMIPRMVDALKEDPVSWYARHNISFPQHLKETGVDKV